MKAPSGQRASLGVRRCTPRRAARGSARRHIESRKGVCGGEPVLAGTRFSVRSVVNYVLLQGLTPEELVGQFPHLSLSAVYAALSYYYDHKPEVDRLATLNEETGRRRAVRMARS